MLRSTAYVQENPFQDSRRSHGCGGTTDPDGFASAVSMVGNKVIVAGRSEEKKFQYSGYYYACYWSFDSVSAIANSTAPVYINTFTSTADFGNQDGFDSIVPHSDGSSFTLVGYIYIESGNNSSLSYPISWDSSTSATTVHALPDSASFIGGGTASNTAALVSTATSIGTISIPAGSIIFSENMNSSYSYPAYWIAGTAAANSL